MASSLAMQLLILTATRTAEALGAEWQDFWFDDAGPAGPRWTLPAHRTSQMSSTSSRSPGEMLAVLERIPKEQGWPAVQPRPLRLLDALQSMPGCSGYTVHGFRSTFVDYVRDETAFDRAVIEETYGHDPALNEAERAYRRGKALKKRRMVLEAWNAYASASKVVPFPAPSKVA